VAESSLGGVYWTKRREPRERRERREVKWERREVEKAVFELRTSNLTSRRWREAPAFLAFM